MDNDDNHQLDEGKTLPVAVVSFVRHGFPCLIIWLTTLFISKSGSIIETRIKAMTAPRMTIMSGSTIEVKAAIF